MDPRYRLFIEKADPVIVSETMEDCIEIASRYVTKLTGDKPTSTSTAVVFAVLTRAPNKLLETPPEYLESVLSIFTGLGLLYERLRNAETH